MVREDRMRYKKNNTDWCGDIAFVKVAPKTWALVIDSDKRVGKSVYYEGGAFDLEGVEDSEKEEILEYFTWHMNYLPDRPTVICEHWRG